MSLWVTATAEAGQSLQTDNGNHAHYFSLAFLLYMKLHSHSCWKLDVYWYISSLYWAQVYNASVHGYESVQSGLSDQNRNCSPTWTNVLLLPKRDHRQDCGCELWSWVWQPCAPCTCRPPRPPHCGSAALSVISGKLFGKLVLQNHKALNNQHRSARGHVCNLQYESTNALMVFIKGRNLNNKQGAIKYADLP